MSFNRNTTINSGPLIIRTALDGSLNNTYLLGQYDEPIGPNYVLMTSNNGQIEPSRDLHFNTLIVDSTITTNTCRATSLSTITVSTTSVSTVYLSTQIVSTSMITCSSLQTSTITTSTIYSNGFTLENGTLRYNVLTKVVPSGSIHILNSTEWWGKYIFVTNPSSDVSLSLPLSGTIPPDGTVMYITNATSGRTTTINNLISGDRSLVYTASAHVIYQSSLNRWFLIS